QNGERRRTAPAKQLRRWRSVRNFSPEIPPCCVGVLDTGHSITPEARARRSKTKPRRADEVRSGRAQHEPNEPAMPRKADAGAGIRRFRFRAIGRHRTLSFDRQHAPKWGCADGLIDEG